jgi:putative addiction module component (TIGR02574 family)
MMASVQDILNAAQSLSSAERAQIIYALWGTVSPGDWAPPSDACVAEAQRRSEALDAGQMTASSWLDVRQRVRRQAGFDE